VVDWILRLPFAWAAAALFAVACLRGQCTFWLGRAGHAGLLKHPRWGRLLTKEGTKKGLAAVEKWGWPIIPLSFLTVGFQTAVQLSAGLLGWRWRRYTLAALPGYLLWGMVYAAGGLAAFGAIASLARRLF
jgi:membrane protein DedA with SNARE-associated domain